MPSIYNDAISGQERGSRGAEHRGGQSPPAYPVPTDPTSRLAGTKSEPTHSMASFLTHFYIHDN